jgi:hypothetical protein
MVRSRSEYYTSMSVSGLPTFLILVKNTNLLSSSIYKHLKTYLIKHKQSLIKLKAEFNAIGSGNWEGINFNRRSFQISMFYRTFSPIYILKSSVLLHFCWSGPTDRRFSGSLVYILMSFYFPFVRLFGVL